MTVPIMGPTMGPTSGDRLPGAAARPKRQFLFLQGLASPFFERLGRALLAAGHGVHRVNFNGGDWVAWRLPGAINFRGRLPGWNGFLERVLTTRGITDIVLFGDCRPLHAAAVGVAQQLQIQVHVFEEGYIRPDWVTLEIGGVNGHSDLHAELSRNPRDYVELARTLPPLEPKPPVPSTFRRRVREDLVYNISSLAMVLLYPGYRTHRPWNILIEYAGWISKLARRPAARKRSQAALARLTSSQRPFFVFPLQLDCDYQIRIHSPFPGMRAAIERVISSFSAHAPEEVLLVIKAHPLDNGLRDWRRCAEDFARAYGIMDRLVFLEEGDIATMVQGARGVVTINSTSGTLALSSGVPVITLGHAIYDIPSITFQGRLDSFWTKPEPPDAETWEAFRRVLVHRCLVHGGFFSEQGLDLLVEASLRRFESAPVATARTIAPARSAASAMPPGALPAAARG